MVQTCSAACLVVMGGGSTRHTCPSSAGLSVSEGPGPVCDLSLTTLLPWGDSRSYQGITAASPEAKQYPVRSSVFTFLPAMVTVSCFLWPRATARGGPSPPLSGPASCCPLADGESPLSGFVTTTRLSCSKQKVVCGFFVARKKRD